MKLLLIMTLLASMPFCLSAQKLSHRLVTLTPGNTATEIQLTERNRQLIATDGSALPVKLTIAQSSNEESIKQIDLRIEGIAPVSYIHYDGALPSDYNLDHADFYLPGFWYHKNMRSPAEAPSFKTSNSWNVREDRLSSPLTGVYDSQSRRGLSVLRLCPDYGSDALTTSLEGDVILSGKSLIGYVGFDNADGRRSLTFGYPYEETPRRYIRKLTLAPPVRAFARISRGEVITLSWLVRQSEDADFGDYVANTWNYCFDHLSPADMTPLFTPDEVKSRLTNYMRNAYVADHPLKFYSSTGINIFNCQPVHEMQLGFCGRVLLNAFNAIEYGDSHADSRLAADGRSVFDSFIAHGFSPEGYIVDFVNYQTDGHPTDVHTIRQQSEGAYAAMLYLDYEQRNGRKHPGWEQALRRLLNRFVSIQNADGSYPRKFNDAGQTIDASSGSTPSATVPLVMGYRLFGQKSYLKAAQRTIDYLEEHIIATSDYFSSTLDANCEDKEAAISAATATYYMALISRGKERDRYIDLCRRATYFAMSWYYLWDVPFAPGQMLGELGFRTRGWGNVSVENNHVDVFAFEQPTITRWVGEQTGNGRFVKMQQLISNSMCQLLPTPERLCGIAQPGFNPEVVQHTTWDYGRGGKGFYNDIFAPGWTIASLWELYTPQRTPQFLKIK